MRFFFFPHGQESSERPAALKKGATPWRVPYQVRGPLVSSSGVEVTDGVVMADGFQTRDGIVVGGNQDPCVLAAPLAGLHSFCRLARRKGTDNDVATLDGGASGALLSATVQPSDVIVYGKPDRSGAFIAVDTVFVVRETRPLRSVVAEVGHHSDAYAFNLSDSRPGGSHEGEDEQDVIVAAGIPTREAVDSLATSFVPLAERDADGKLRVIRIGPGDVGGGYDELHRVFRATMFSGPATLANKGRICELPPTAGEALVRAVVSRSRNARVTGAVFVPPLRLQGTAPRRLGGDGQIRQQADHLASLR